MILWWWRKISVKPYHYHEECQIQPSDNLSDDVESVVAEIRNKKPKEHLEHSQSQDPAHYQSRDFRAILEQSGLDEIWKIWKSPEQRTVYRNFIETQISVTSVLILAMGLTCVLLGTMITGWSHGALRSGSSVSVGLLAARGSSSVIGVIGMWCVWYLKRLKKLQKLSVLLGGYLPVIQAVASIAWSTGAGLTLIHQVVEGACNGDVAKVNCNRDHGGGGLPVDTVIAVIFIPMSIFVVLMDTRFSAVLISFFVSSASIIASGIFVGYQQVWGISTLQIVSCVLVIYETQRQKVSLFLVADRLHTLLVENERNAEEVHATELRHMIGNVAHDLKTPLASFTSGLDMILQILNGCRRGLESSDNVMNPREILRSLEEIMSYVGNINDTNSFMVMAINRCIDFTKASKGMTLSARLETVHLEDAIGLPVRIMRDLKSSVSISVSELGSEVCSHVITDKQWLQENLLCLLSNAVKYSGRGSSVDVCVRLMSGDAVRKFVEDDHSKCGGEEVFSATLHQIGPTQSSGSVETHGRARVYSNETVNIDEPNKVESNGSQFHGHDFSASDVSCSSPHMQGDDKINSPKHKRAKFVTVRGGQNKRETGQDKFLFLEVQDTGIGLTDEARRNLFKPFKQAQRLAGGTGLGLFSLAKRLDALGGYYGVKGRRDGGEGSLFWFAFPYRPDMESASLAAASPKRVDMKYTATLRMTGETYDPSGTSNALAEVDKMSLKVASKDDDECDRKGLRILLVDDSLSILKMTRMMLMRHKHEVMTAENGLEALEVMKAAYEKMLRSRMGKVDSTGGRRRSRGGKRGSMAPFDVLLMDLQMPVLDGLESARRIRSLEEEFTKRHEIDLQSNYDSVSNLGENGVGRVLCSPQSNDFTYCHQFIVGVSANSDEQTVDQSHMAGFDAFIGKPFQVETLYAVLEEHLKDEEG